MPGTLYVVATPIGNLEDVTFRAVRVLREVDLVAAEDTRRTAILLRHYQIQTPTTSLHEHNEIRVIPAIISRLVAGQAVAVVSDAGTPAISDPGYRLVRAAIEAGIRVEAIPGASAVLAALVSSGLPTDSFLFVGFPPIRSKARIEWLKRMAGQPHTVIFFESPRRLHTTLREMSTILAERPIVVARELTKIHETLVIGPIREVLRRLPSDPKGEVTVVISPCQQADPSRDIPSDSQLSDEYGQITESQEHTRREAIRTLATRHGLSARQVYAALLRTRE